MSYGYSTGTIAIAADGLACTLTGGNALLFMKAGDDILIGASGERCLIDAVSSADAFTLAYASTQADTSGLSFQTRYGPSWTSNVPLAEQVADLIGKMRYADAYGRGPVFTFDAATADADPGPGLLRLNHADPASATAIYIDDLDQVGNSAAAIIDAMTVDTLVGVRAVDDPARYGVYKLTVTAADGSGYRRLLSLTELSAAGAFVAGEDVKLEIALSGATGVPIGHRLTFSSSIVDADPGAGTFRADSATFGSITKLWINNADADALDITAWLDSFDDVANANARGYLTLQGQYDPSIVEEFAITGAVTDKTDYREILVSPISGAIPANTSVLVASFSKSGADGAGDVSGPTSSVAGHLALYDGVTGKQLKDAGNSISGRVAIIADDYALELKNAAQASWFLRQLTTDNEFALHLNGVGNLLTLDSAGRLLLPNTPAFHVSGGQIAAATSGTFLIGNYGTPTIWLNNGANFNTASGAWTAPVDCLMALTATVSSDAGTAHNIQIVIRKNGAAAGPASLTYYSAFQPALVSIVVQLSAGEYVDAAIIFANGASSAVWSSEFSGHMVG